MFSFSEFLNILKMLRMFTVSSMFVLRKKYLCKSTLYFILIIWDIIKISNKLEILNILNMQKGDSTKYIAYSQKE
jgi:hypothetical protein